MAFDWKKNKLLIIVVGLSLVALVLYFTLRDDSPSSGYPRPKNPGGGGGGSHSGGSSSPPASPANPGPAPIKIGDVVKAKYDGTKVWKDEGDNKTATLSFLTEAGELLGIVYAIKDSYYQVFNGSRGGWIYKESVKK